MKVVASAPCTVSAAQCHPLYISRPAAGFPAPGDDEVEQALDLNDLLIDNKEATFFVRVEGDSMEGARIFSGDILVVDRSLRPLSGQIVVAAVYGEMVVKRALVYHDRTELVSENPAYEPIVISDPDACFIWGVAVGCVRVL